MSAFDGQPGESARRDRVTVADVARVAGVSPAAVSLALRGEPGVGAETRRRIIEVARTLGYRGVRRGAHRRTFGLVIKAFRGDAPGANRFYAPVMAGIEELCRSRDVDLRFASMPVDDEYVPTAVPRLVTDRSCDGLIVAGAHLSEGTAHLLQDGPPVILVDAYADDGIFDSVGSDNVGGARTAVEYLVERGHRHIALVGSRRDSYPSILQRRRGYEQAITEAELEPHIADSWHYPPEIAADAGMAYIRRHPEVTAAFCCNDDVAIALMRAAARERIRVPDDLSIIGHDDIDQASFISPALTTLAVDKVGMGRLAVSLLLHRLERGAGAATQTLLRPSLVERASVRRARPAESVGPAESAGRAEPIRQGGSALATS